MKMDNVMNTTMNTAEAVHRILSEQNRLMQVGVTLATYTDLDHDLLDELREDLKLHQAMGVMLLNTTKLLTIQHNPFNREDGGQ